MEATTLRHRARLLADRAQRLPLAAAACLLLAILAVMSLALPLPGGLAATARATSPAQALAWACMAAGLLIGRRNPGPSAGQQALGAVVIVLALLPLRPGLGFGALLGAPMPLVTAGLVCAGLSLFTPPIQLASLASTALLRWLPALVLTVLALLGIMSLTLGRQSGELWLASFDIPPGPAIAFLLLTLSLLREPPDARVASLREDFRISIMSLTVLTAVVVVTGIATFWAVQGRLQESEQERLVQSAYRREMAFNFQLANASRLAADLAQSSNIGRAMAMWRTQPKAATAALDDELSAIWRDELIALRFELATPFAQLPSRGDFLKSALPGVVLEQASDMHFELQWNDGLMAYAKTPVLQAGQLVGWVMSQQRLPLMTEQLFETTDLGQHVQVRLCAPASAELAWCMPSHPGGSIVQLPLTDAKGLPSAIGLATRGEQGATVAADDKGTAVIDVYASVQRPLGLTLRQSIDTVMAPVREKLRQVFVVIGAMLVLGLVILNLQVRPLARRLALNEGRLSTVMSNVSDGIVTTDAQGRITFLNLAAETLTGWQSSEALGKPVGDVFQMVDATTDRAVDDVVARALAGQAQSAAVDTDLLHRSANRRLPITHTVSLLKDRGGAIVGTVLVFHDATSARTRSAAISYEASHDALTGLINRKEFERRLSALAHEEAAGESHHHSLLYIDLDKFKQVNDTAGHAAGDELLRQVTRLMQKSLRASDMLARVGGDEFTVILPRCGLQDASRVATQLKTAVADFTFDWQGQRFHVGTSIGVASFEPGCGDLAAIVSTADAACYRAKKAGRNNVQLHDALLTA